jgi:hypothetical protein
MAYYGWSRPTFEIPFPQPKIGRRSTRKRMMAPDRGFRVVRKMHLPPGQ